MKLTKRDVSVTIFIKSEDPSKRRKELLLENDNAKASKAVVLVGNTVVLC